MWELFWSVTSEMRSHQLAQIVMGTNMSQLPNTNFPATKTSHVYRLIIICRGERRNVLPHKCCLMWSHQQHSLMVSCSQEISLIFVYHPFDSHHTNSKDIRKSRSKSSPHSEVPPVLWCCCAHASLRNEGASLIPQKMWISSRYRN